MVYTIRWPWHGKQYNKKTERDIKNIQLFSWHYGFQQNEMVHRHPQKATFTSFSLLAASENGFPKINCYLQDKNLWFDFSVSLLTFSFFAQTCPESLILLPAVQVPLSTFQPHHGGNYLYALVCAVTVVYFVSQVCPSAWTARRSSATVEKTEGQSSTGWKGKSLSKNLQDTLKKVKSGKDTSDASVVPGDWKYKVKHKP